MDVVLGVAVTGPVARLALVGSGGQGADVIDQSVVDVADNPIAKLTETVVGTNRLLADENHRLTATRLCWTDDLKADQLRRALEDSGVMNVAVLSESQAVTALMRAAGRAGGVLVVDDETATLSVVGSAAGQEDAPPTLLASAPLARGDATTTFDTLMARLGDQPNAPQNLYLVGASSHLTSVADQLRDASTMRVEVGDDPTFALARGTALAAAPDATMAAPLAGGPFATMAAPALTGDETAMAPRGDDTAMAPRGDDTAFAPASEPAAEEQQLAYSMADEGEPFDEFGDENDDVDDVGAATGRLPLSRRSLVLGNAVIAFAVIGFASLAVAVVVAVRPTASQEPVVGHQNAAPGKFMPLLPTQQQAPVPPPPPDEPNAGFQGGVIPDSNGYIPPQLMSPGGGGSPPVAPVNPAPVAPVAPGAPGIPGLMPNPNGPIPIPIIIPFPVLRPPFNPPFNPPFSPPTIPTTPTTPTITPFTPPTTPSTPSTKPLVPTTPSTPSTKPLVPTTTVPTTQAPTPKTTVPTTVAPTTKAPTQQTVTPPPTQSQQTVAPKPVTPTQPQQTVAPKPVTPTQPVNPKPVTPQIPQQPRGGGGGGGGGGGNHQH
ncbi:MAG TPA: hypothetical protein VLL82_10290 [Mycobacterium sp.]|nr:hypothetical protein [Mycobacterium sp.]